MFRASCRLSRLQRPLSLSQSLSPHPHRPCSSSSAQSRPTEHTKLDGFLQVLRISFPADPAAEGVFGKVLSKLARDCLQLEQPHLAKFDVMKEQKSRNFVIYQSYNSREGFLQHRTSTHFEDFMRAAGPVLTGDILLSEYKSIFPAQDAWDQISPQQNVKESLTIQVSMTVQEDRKHDFLLATQKHIIETVDNFSSLDGDKSNFPIRMFLMQNTMNRCDFELLIMVRGMDGSSSNDSNDDSNLKVDMLKSLRDSASYLEWTTTVHPWLQSPRRSKRYDNIDINL